MAPLTSQAKKTAQVRMIRNKVVQTLRHQSQCPAHVRWLFWTGLAAAWHMQGVCQGRISRMTFLLPPHRHSIVVRFTPGMHFTLEGRGDVAFLPST
jgi:hypothetical protein